MAYPFKQIEQKWQAYWQANKTFKTPDEPDKKRPKYYVLDMFPYPSGSGLHVGHPEGYTATDIIARYKRLNGYNVLHPMGWDAYGLPAEQYAIETGTHPAVTTRKNIDRFREQLQAIGFSYDWDREVDTTDPAYYRWTQWIFLQLYKKGLAYVAEVPVNWCPALGTVLANEEVIDGRSERGDHPVYRRPMKQWMLKITEYAERLLDDLEDLDWPESTKEMQRNWIGKSEGAEINFAVDGFPDKTIRVFTTRPDTLFGATYMVLSPEHELVEQITSEAQKETVDAYCQAASRKSDLERTELQKDKTGVFCGAYAINPVTDKPIPVWIADYVLASYGTGAIMAVPAHDERDHEFASKYNLPIIEVIAGGDVQKEAYVTQKGKMVNSSTEIFSIDGREIADAKAAICDWFEAQNIGRRQINYKLRDWLFSRQRYWGEPFPILFGEDGEVRALPEEDLPLTLPEMDDYKPAPADESTIDPLPPLARADEDWRKVVINGKTYTREFNTMPQWAGSCWYYLRFIDPKNNEAFVDSEKERYWMNVDLYVGGAEHSVLHLLYARFWHKVLYDLGHVSTTEPFQKLIHQGMILGEMEFSLYLDENDQAVSADAVDKNGIYAKTGTKLTRRTLPESEVKKQGDTFVWGENEDIQVDARAFKMSKSRGNVINPDQIVDNFGADSLRLYEMFMGPLEQMKPWSMKGVEGVNRFLNRVWRLVMDGHQEDQLSSDLSDEKPNNEQLRELHTMIKKVSEDIEEMRFNTAIAAMMSFVNEAMKWGSRPRDVLSPFMIVLNPFAPHLAEELWQYLGNKKPISGQDWPVADESLLVKDSVEIVVQVNGKLRHRLQAPNNLAREALEQMVRQEERIAELLQGKTVMKVIVVPNKLVNIVVR